MSSRCLTGSMIFVFERSLAVGRWPSIHIYSAVIFATTQDLLGRMRVDSRNQPGRNRGCSAAEFVPFEVRSAHSFLHDPCADAEGVRDGGNHRIESEAARHEARIDDKDVRGLMNAAVAVDDRLARIVAHAAGAHLMVADEIDD